MAQVQPTNLNAFHADLDEAKHNLKLAESAVAEAEARLVAAGGKVPKPEKAEAEAKPKKGKGSK